jgi:large subunit ribosomal protein L25
MSESLNVKRRDELGTARNRRLRKTGQVPAILYGHGEQNVSLAVSHAEILAAVKHGGKLVALQGDVTESALIRALQWDTFGKQVLHVDLMRVSETETVETTITVELRGTAIGVNEGGVIQHILHELDIECPAAKIPEKIVVVINDLHLGKAIHAGEVPLPEGAKMLTDAELVVVQCTAPHAELEVPAPGAEGGAEPELIRKEKGEEGAEE